MSYNYLDKNGTSYDVGKTKTLINDTKVALQSRITSMQSRLTDMQQQLNQLSSNIDWKEAVNTYADIATTYPNPQDGWTVNVKDTDYTYRYNGTAWVVISANAIPDATPFVKGLMTTAQVTKLNSLDIYVLPVAKTNELGGIKPDGTTITVDQNGVAVARGESKSISNLTDTQITNPQDGQVLTWDSSINKWINGDGGENIFKLGDVSGATVTQTSGAEQVSIIWSDPQDVEAGNIKLAEWKGTKVIRKENVAPSSISDGDVVVDSLVRNQYSSTALVDSNVEYGKTYYYRFFPYTTGGVVTAGSSRNVRIDMVSTEIPVQSGTLTYTGASQSPILSTNTGFTTSGDTSGTNAGNYELIATLESGREWSDLTTAPKTVAWSIQKKTESAIASSENVTLDADHLTSTVTISNLQGRVIDSVESDDTSVATVSVNNNEITIQHVNQTDGTATVTVTIEDNMNYNGCVLSIAVTADFNTTPSLNDSTWAEINAAALDGTASALWNVGDKKEIILNGTFTSDTTFANKSIYAFIIGFNHNSSYEGNNKIHFQLGMEGSANSYKVGVGQDPNICMFTTALDTTTHSVNNGWANSYMKGTIIPAFKPCLPSDLRSVMATVTKWTDNVGEYYPMSSGNVPDCEHNVSASTEEIFLLSEYEYAGARTYANPYEQTNQLQYAYYANGNSKAFYIDKNNINPNYDYIPCTWTRSVATSDVSWLDAQATYFVSINTSDSSATIYTRERQYVGTSSVRCGFAPAFVVGKALE